MFFQVIRNTVYRSDHYETHEAFFASETTAREYAGRDIPVAPDSLVIYACDLGEGEPRRTVATFTQPVSPFDL